jgi:hypothetical protein
MGTGWRQEEHMIGRMAIVLLAGALGMGAFAGMEIGASNEAVLSREEELSEVTLVSDDDGGGDTGNSRSRDSRDTTAERSRSRDRSKDRTGGGRRFDRSRSRDRSADNTRDHSVGFTTQD